VLRQRLEQSERNAVLYAAQRGIVALDTKISEDGKTTTQRTLASTNLEALNQALTKARAERIEAESRTGAGAAEMSPEVLGNAAISGMRQKRAELAAEYANLMVRS
jgi:succinoglycan biosynthesis transport protein ExoP